ncbi:MAG: flagellar hook-length control protein FliK [Bradymonadales bacterium]|nr:MAG: flagellar hook-length control protein FliK [Bradymonadales bacterium]
MQISMTMDGLLSSNRLEMDRPGVSNPNLKESNESFLQVLGRLVNPLADSKLADHLGYANPPDEISEGSELEARMLELLAALEEGGLENLQAALSSGGDLSDSDLLVLREKLQAQLGNFPPGMKSSAEHFLKAKLQESVKGGQGLQASGLSTEEAETAIEKMNFFSRNWRGEDSSRLMSREMRAEARAFEELRMPHGPSGKSSVDEFAKQLMIQKDLGETAWLKSAGNSVERATPFSRPLGEMQQNLFEDMRGQLTKMVKTQSGGDMTLQLRPGNLGRVEVRVVVEGDLVRVNLVAEQKAGEQALRSQITELRAQLQGIGLKVDELNLQNLKSSSETQDHRSDQSQDEFAREFARNQEEKTKNQRASEENQSEVTETLIFEELLAS